MSSAYNTAKKAVRKACKLMNPETAIGDLTPFNDIAVIPLRFTFHWATHLSDHEFDRVFHTFIENMRGFYEMSKWGYNPSMKKQEMRSPTSRFIFAHDENDSIVGYVHYRFAAEGPFAVLYCYEIQVVKEHQGKSVGTALIAILESMGKKLSMNKIMATVFAFNGKSLAFFHKMQFSADESCPSVDDGLDYLILSKVLD